MALLLVTLGSDCIHGTAWAYDIPACSRDDTLFGSVGLCRPLLNAKHKGFPSGVLTTQPGGISMLAAPLLFPLVFPLPLFHKV